MERIETDARRRILLHPHAGIVVLHVGRAAGCGDTRDPVVDIPNKRLVTSGQHVAVGIVGVVSTSQRIEGDGRRIIESP